MLRVPRVGGEPLLLLEEGRQGEDMRGASGEEMRGTIGEDTRGVNGVNYWGGHEESH